MKSLKKHSFNNDHNINLKAFTEEFEILCKSYIGKYKSGTIKTVIWKLLKNLLKNKN